MRIGFFVSVFVVFFLKLVVCEECCSCDSPNVKTVLFKKTDLEKDCWEHTDVALLLARRLIQELVPRKVPVNIALMKKYFDLSEQNVDQIATSNSSRMMLHTAYADTVGGYLYAYGLPVAKEAYYEGKVDYEEAKRLYELAKKLKLSLGTDGKGWSTPTSVSKFANKVEPLKVPTTAVENPCESLITNDLLVVPKSKSRETRQSISKYYAAKEPMIEKTGPLRDEMIIPLPFLDDEGSPSALAVPFRNRSLYSLTNPMSAEILSRYYTTSILCLKGIPGESVEPGQSQYYYKKTNQVRRTRKTSHDASEKFEFYFYHWINDKVIPRLDDETWYVGFGGILRVTETIRRKGSQNLDTTSRLSSPRRSSTFPIGGSLPQEALEQHLDKDRDNSSKKIPSRRPAILPSFPKHPSCAFYFCTICLIILSFWLISSVFFVIVKVYRERNSKRAADNRRDKRNDLYTRLLDANDTDVEDFMSDEVELPLGRTPKRWENPKSLSGHKSAQSDLNDKFSTDDNDITVSSLGVSNILSDGTEVSAGRLNSTAKDDKKYFRRRTILIKEISQIKPQKGTKSDLVPLLIDFRSSKRNSQEGNK